MVFSIALDESVNINDIPCLAVMARHCDHLIVREELCCLKPMPGTTKGEVFMEHFNELGVDMSWQLGNCYDSGQPPWEMCTGGRS